MTVIIGKGEKTALEVLKEIYGEDVEYKTQIPFKDLMLSEFSDDLSERQQKETVDIVLFSGFNPVCVRVQGGDHTGILKSTVLFKGGIPIKWEDYYPSAKLKYIEEFNTRANGYRGRGYNLTNGGEEPDWDPDEYSYHY